MDLIQEIGVLNAKVKELNKRRDKLLWEKTRAEEELTKLLQEYNTKYGKNLTPADIVKEFESVKADLERQFISLRYAVDHINDVPKKPSPTTGTGSVGTGISGVADSSVTQSQQYAVPSEAQGYTGVSGVTGVSNTEPRVQGYQTQTQAPQQQTVQGVQPQSKRVGSMADLEANESVPSLEDRLMGFDFSKYVGG